MFLIFNACDSFIYQVYCTTNDNWCHVDCWTVDFENVTGLELNPLITLLDAIREEYCFRKPEVFKTIVAVLNDYKPMCGQKHREKVIRSTSLYILS